ncbi:MAG: hypothetical protein ACETWQ_17595 [Phycisphaerae bacterium]
MRMKEQQKLAEHYLNVSKYYLRRKEWLNVIRSARYALQLKEQICKDGDSVTAETCFVLGCAYCECVVPSHTPSEDWDKAEELWHKAKEIWGRLGNQVEVGTIHFNLGHLYVKRGDISRVREHWEFARDIYKGLGRDQMVQHVEEQIADIPSIFEKIKQAEAWLNEEDTRLHQNDK